MREIKRGGDAGSDIKVACQIYAEMRDTTSHNTMLLARWANRIKDGSDTPPTIPWAVGFGL